MSTHNICFEQKYKKNVTSFYQFFVVKFSIYLNNLNRRVFVMVSG